MSNPAVKIGFSFFKPLFPFADPDAGPVGFDLREKIGILKV
jgi:hypothetical protein